LPEQWKESIIVPIYEKGDKTDCSNTRDISLLSTSYKIVSNILLSRLIPYIDEIIGDHQCGFRHNRSAINQMFLACFPYFEEEQNRLIRSRCCVCVRMCVSVYPPIIAKERLGKSLLIVARQRLGKNTPIVARQRLGKNPPIVASQRLCRYVTPVTNTHATIEELLDASFSVWPMSYQGK
jgi:hypothetical protein